MRLWLDGSPDRVAVLHCKGKTMSAGVTVILKIVIELPVHSWQGQVWHDGVRLPAHARRRPDSPSAQPDREGEGKDPRRVGKLRLKVAPARVLVQGDTLKVVHHGAAKLAVVQVKPEGFTTLLHFISRPLPLVEIASKPSSRIPWHGAEPLH